MARCARRFRNVPVRAPEIVTAMCASFASLRICAISSADSGINSRSAHAPPSSTSPCAGALPAAALALIVHALFEVAIDVFKRAKSIEPRAILDAIVATNYSSIVGPVRWTGQPVKNVSKTPLVAGQWQRHGDGFELVITANKPAPEIPVGGTLELLS